MYLYNASVEELPSCCKLLNEAPQHAPDWLNCRIIHGSQRFIHYRVVGIDVKRCGGQSRGRRRIILLRIIMMSRPRRREEHDAMTTQWPAPMQYNIYR